MFEEIDKALRIRRSQLFAIACCRRIWHLLEDPRLREAVEIYEAGAEFQRMPRTYFSQFQDLIGAVGQSHDYGDAALDNARLAVDYLGYGQLCCEKAAEAMAFDREHIDGPNWYEAHDAERKVQSDLFRDIVGNPFQSVKLDPSWLTPNVVDLARTIYEERAFDRLPILSDALMDAGCEDEQILAHCRTTGQHVRGCWVVDLILER